MRTAQTPPVTALIAQMLLLAGLAVIVGLTGAGLSPAGWAVGISCGVITTAALARGLAYYRADRLSPADWVTLARATLAVGVAALVADSFAEPAPVTLLVSLASLALVLDAVDGWVARRTQTTAALGAHFDAEVDAFLILVLSVYVARSVGAWVLAIGAARYAFLAAGWVLPWMRAPLPPRYWRKFVAATQGIVLTIAAADVLPPAVNQGRARRRPRRCSPSRSAATCGGCGPTGRHTHEPDAGRDSSRRDAHATVDPRRGCDRPPTDAAGAQRRSPPCSRSSPCCSCGPPSSPPTSRSISTLTRS